MIVWLYGLSGAGKTTIARALKEIYTGAIHLDGDILRKGLNSDLGFSVKDRTENIRRVIEVCKIFGWNNMIICSFITPMNNMRKKIKDEIDGHLIYCKCSIKKCIERDVKGLYKERADKMTGIGSPFEEPDIADLIIDTEKTSEHESLDKLMEYINKVR